jgi:hypothetical protein
MPSWILGNEISHTVLCLVGKDVWNDGHFVLSQKFMHGQSRMARVFCAGETHPQYSTFGLFSPHIFPQTQ